MTLDCQNSKPALPRSVLVVDDDVTNRKLLRAYLEAEGIETREAADGLAALAALDAGPLDAVITDILMPGMDGYQFCRELRQQPRFAALPVIFVTNTYTSPGDRELALAMGGSDYLTRPVSTADLTEALRRAFSCPGPGPAKRALPPPPEFVMQKYASVLVQKLEHKNQQLEKARTELESLNRDLEKRVRDRTAELQAANEELDAFAHSVSHDLLAPLRAIRGFAEILDGHLGGGPDEEGRRCLDCIHASTRRMRELIEDLLRLSKVSRAALVHSKVHLSALAGEVAQRLREAEPERRVDLRIQDGLIVEGDLCLLRIALENLLGNAWKFTAKTPEARVELGGRTDPSGERVCFVRDNGAGFDMEYAAKLFSPFERLHSAADFPGTGIGLATVHRIVRRHFGKIWAQAAPGQGATFFFILGDSPIDL